MSYQLIEYYGQELTLKQIAIKEGIIDVTLTRHYKKTNNIYKAVKKAKQVSRGKVGKIEYNGEKLSLYAIAQKSGTSYYTLRGIFPDETSDIYIAIKICQEKQREKELKQNQKDDDGDKEEYYGQKMQLREIAHLEEIDAKLLRRCYKEIKEPYRAVFMAKSQDRENQKVKMENVVIDLYDMSILLGIKYSNLINLLNSGMSINEIKEKYEKKDDATHIQAQNKQILLEFCIEKKINFSFMYRAIYTYKKSFAEAIQTFFSNDGLIPSNWIYDRYSTIIQKADISKLQVTAIMNELKNNTISLKEAIETCVVRKNSVKHNLSSEWGKSLYGLVQARKLLGNEFEEQISINENEEQFASECELEIQGMMEELQNLSKIFSRPDTADIKCNDYEQEL